MRVAEADPRGDRVAGVILILMRDGGPDGLEPIPVLIVVLRLMRREQTAADRKILIVQLVSGTVFFEACAIGIDRWSVIVTQVLIVTGRVSLGVLRINLRLAGHISALDFLLAGLLARLELSQVLTLSIDDVLSAGNQFIFSINDWRRPEVGKELASQTLFAFDRQYVLLELA